MRKVSPILVCLSASLLCQPGFSATVTNTSDNGPGTLRKAIADALPGETIGFSINGPIILTNGELLINKNLTISGPGSGSLTIQRSTASRTTDFRIFNIQSGIVTISGLTVSNGRADVGAGINNETTTTLRDCVILGNTATNRGGGVYNGSTLTNIDCRLVGNAVTGVSGAGYGGGLDNDGTFTATNCSFSSNSVTGAGGTNGFGGGINNSGTLGITNSAVNGNFASDSGGGIFNEGTVELSKSTVGSNTAKGGNGTGRGGGIANTIGTVTLDRSTISNNSAGMAGARPGQGGGIANDTGTLTVCNSTLSGNIASGGVGGGSPPQGGGIFNGLGSVTLNNSTVTANVIPGGFPLDGGGLFNSAGAVEGIENNILAGNIATIDVFNGPQGDVLSSGFNLFGSRNGIIMPGPSDRFNFTASQLKLGSLQANGGPTFTHALLCGSPAINAGGDGGCSPTDQRGFSRVVGGIIDIGAYEYNNTAPTVICPLPTSAVAVSSPPVVTLTVQVADPDGNPLTVVWLLDGVVSQTNQVVVNGPSVPANVSFTRAFGAGVHTIQVRVNDPQSCEAACSTIVYVTSAQNPCEALILGLTGSPPASVSSKIGSRQ